MAMAQVQKLSRKRVRGITVQNMFPNSQEWQVSVLNDDVNLASFVVLMLMRELGISQESATCLTLQIDELGGATVFTGLEDSCQALVKTFHSYGLQAIMEPVPQGAN